MIWMWEVGDEGGSCVLVSVVLGDCLGVVEDFVDLGGFGGGEVGGVEGGEVVFDLGDFVGVDECGCDCGLVEDLEEGELSE